MMKFPSPWQLDFDIDKYLNRFVPQSRLHRLPQPLSWFLGHRKTPQGKPGNVLIWIWAFIGAFTGIILIEGVVKSSPLLQSHGNVLIIGSFVRGIRHPSSYEACAKRL